MERRIAPEDEFNDDRNVRLITKYPKSVALLRGQLRTAFSLIEDACRDQNPATAWQCIDSARSALESVERMLGRIPIAPDDALELRRSAGSLRDELKRFGTATVDAA